MISKSSFIRGLQCLKSLYLHKKRPFLRDALSAETRAKFKRGHEVGELAWNLFPGGIKLASSNPKAYQKNIELVNKHIASKSPVMYEVPFINDELIAIMDILTFGNGCWNAYEVKSSLTISDTYLWDITFQAYVIKTFGLNDVNYHIIHLNSEYEHGYKTDYNKLFSIINVDEEIEKRIGLLEPLIEKMRETEKALKSPQISIGKHCNSPYVCDFQGHCWKHIIQPSVFQVSGFPDDFKFKLLQEGKSDLHSAIPFVHDIKLKQRISAILHNETYADKEKILSFFSDCDKNVSILKIFAHSPAVPTIEGHKPFQWTPLEISAAQCDKHYISGIRHYFFEENSNYYVQLKQCFVELLESANCFICYGDSEAMRELLKNLFTDDTLNNLYIADVKFVFTNDFYCAPITDPDLKFESVSSYLFNKTETKSEFKNMTEVEVNIQKYFQTEKGRKKITDAGKMWIEYILKVKSKMIEEIS